MNFDAGTRQSNPGPSAISVIMRNGGPDIRAAQFIGIATNNFAEYRALLLALEMASVVPPAVLEIRSDSRLVVEQVLGNWRVRGSLREIHYKVQRAADLLRSRGFDIQIKHVPRKDNAEADRMVTDLLDEHVGKRRGY